MEKITLKIDGIQFHADPGQTILEVAMENGIYIPNLCYNEDLKPASVCRLCLVEENNRLITSCNTSVSDGMDIKTETHVIDETRRLIVELLLVNHERNCLECNQSTDCKLQKAANYVGVDEERLSRLKTMPFDKPIDQSNPFFDFNPNKCILCGVCVRTCAEIAGVHAIDFSQRGYSTQISTFGDNPLIDSRCISCGECLMRCPTGALSIKERRGISKQFETICPYCGCGCSLILGVRGNKIISVVGNRNGPVNKGRLCVKGRFGLTFPNHPDRLTTPLVRENGKFAPTSWDKALNMVSSKFKKFKGDQFAVFTSAKCTNEENYMIQKFTRAVMGTNNIDHCARLCHAPTVAGLAQSFGSGAMTNSIEPLSQAECIFVIGSNTTTAHPIIAHKVKYAVKKGARLIIASPKEIDLREYACVYLQLLPGTDVALLMGMMKIIVDENLQNNAFINHRCENYEAFKKSLSGFDLGFVEATTQVPKEDLIKAARIYAQNSPASILYAMGITQHTHGTDNVLAIANLALLTGNIGKLSSGVNPLRGQNNVQGACDMGGLPNVYPGYQKVDLPKIHKKFESAWKTSLSDRPGKTHTEIIDDIDKKKIKALYVVGENPILSEADANHVEKAVNKLGFMVVQDMFLTETAKMADVVLPAASFAEKNGTFTNTERRVQLIRKAIAPIGESKPDDWIVCEIAKRMGAKNFEHRQAEEIMEEIASLTPQYGGISHNRLERESLQWPCPDKHHPGTTFLHRGKFPTASGKGKFIPLKYRPSAELPDETYPFILTTGRSLYHFHTATMTRKVEGLNVLRHHERVEINPVDAERLGIETGTKVTVTSRRGQVEAKAFVTDLCPDGVINMTFHFAECPTNVLTNCAVDPVAKIPETKVCAVAVEKKS